MKNMKAFLSEIHHRTPSLNEWRYLPGSAVREANRVLAEAEPHERWRENSLGFPCYLRCRQASMEPWNVGGALAESLAAFIAEPIQ